MNIKINLVLIVWFMSFNIIFARHKSPLISSQKNKNNTHNFTITKSTYFKDYLPKWYNVITNVPVDFYQFGKMVFNKNSIKPLTILTAITLGSMIEDQKNWENTKILCKRSLFLTNITNSTVNLGDGKWQLGAAGAAMIYGYFAKDDKVLNTSFESVEAICASGLFVQLLKHCSGRQSPADHTKPGGFWDFFPEFSEYQNNQPGFYSFPSGHITGATTILTVINENYPNVTWLKPISFAVLGSLGFSLVANDMHWYSDLPLGIAIGYCFGKIISHRYEINTVHNKNEKFSYSVIPVLNKDGLSIEFDSSF